jgi:hypothetical protein
MIFFYEFLNFEFRDATNFFENFSFWVFECQNNDYEGSKSVSLKLRIIVMLTGSFSHLNEHVVTSRYRRPRNT